MTTKSSIKFAFFGTIPLAQECLDALEAQGLVPALVVAGQDRLARDKSVIFPIEKEWAVSRGVPVEQPKELTDVFLDKLAGEPWDVFIVASYGKILPKRLLEIPEKGTINLHPSLLPKLRGPSPIRSAILNDEKETGVSIMLLDDKMDHGPLLGQKTATMPERPMHGMALDALLAREGAELLAELIPKWVSGEIRAQEQDHSAASYCKIFLKEDGEIDLSGDATANLRKIRALEGWPGSFAYFERNGEKIRVVIVDAHIEGSKLVLDTVKPEGKGPMPYADFVRSGARSL